MSKYGTFPASPSSTPAPDGASAALDSTSCADDKAPGASASSPASARRRPWRELADPSALSVPRGLADARRRAQANLARFAANYELAVVVVVSVSLLTWRLIAFPIVITYLAAPPGKAVSHVLLVLSLSLLMQLGATARVLASLPVGILLVVVHAVLHRPADSVDGGGDEEEAGRCGTPPPSTN